MPRYIFDARRLTVSAKQQEQGGYAVAGRMLREYLGGDVLAEVRRRIRTDPRFHALLDELRTASAHADEVLADELKRRHIGSTN
jgi:hypothetical protein